MPLLPLLYPLKVFFLSFFGYFPLPLAYGTISWTTRYRVERALLVPQYNEQYKSTSPNSKPIHALLFGNDTILTIRRKIKGNPVLKMPIG
jgi:hypothetical protein